MVSLSRHEREIVPRLYLVTDRTATGGRPLVEVVARALQGIPGSGLAPRDVAVQLREKDLPGRALAELGRALRAVTAAAGVRLFVNDRVDVALAVGADGIHLGGSSLTTGETRAFAPGLSVAISAHKAADVRAQGGAAAFAVFGPIRDTPSKRAFGSPVGWRALADAVSLGTPLLAIGGVGAEDVSDAVAAGAQGIACIRPVMQAADPTEAVRKLAGALASSAHGAPAGDPYRT
jgi:thiamine-phosphate pyrophosphorylase